MAADPAQLLALMRAIATGDDAATSALLTATPALARARLDVMQSLVADLRSESGQELLRALVPQIDVLIVNMPPSLLERVGLTWTQLSALNPDLVMVIVSGFGLDGPYAGRPGNGRHWRWYSLCVLSSSSSPSRPGHRSTIGPSGIRAYRLSRVPSRHERDARKVSGRDGGASRRSAERAPRGNRKLGA